MNSCMSVRSGVFIDGVAHPGSTYYRNQFFSSASFPGLIAALQAAQNTGRGAVATVRLQTVQNDWCVALRRGGATARVRTKLVETGWLGPLRRRVGWALRYGIVGGRLSPLRCCFGWGLRYGIVGGREVVMTVVYLSRASAWEQQLPRAVQELVVPTEEGADKDMSLLRKTGHYRNFPHFNTAHPSLDGVRTAPRNLIVTWHSSALRPCVVSSSEYRL